MLLSTSAVSVFAQSALVATLSHEGEITAFYGASALQQAHEAATHGDVITLSSGSFLPVDITKAITLRGAGMELDSVNNILPTVISESFNINIADETSECLIVEGIFHNHQILVYGTLTKAQFIKSRFSTIKPKGTEDGCFNNCTFQHCKITNGITVSKDNSSLVFLNSYVCHFVYANPYPTSAVQFVNCIVVGGKESAGLESLKNSTILNCILTGVSGGDDNKLPDSSVAYNCVGITGGSLIFYRIPNGTNFGSTYEEVFKDFTGTYTDATTFELTDEAKATFLGTDGTQVGIYGGRMPYSPITTNPRITKCDVAAKSTADGKLSVDLEVSGAE